MNALNADVVLETQRLRLRPLKASDAGMIGLYTADERVARMTGRIPHPLPPGSAEGFVARVLAGEVDEVVWAIEHKMSAAEELVGVAGLKPDGEVGYWIAAPFWSTGFATEALEAIVAYAFHSGFTRLAACVFQDNPASARVLTKAGFGYTGDGAGHSVARNATIDTWTYALEADHWPRRH